MVAPRGGGREMTEARQCPGWSETRSTRSTGRWAAAGRAWTGCCRPGPSCPRAALGLQPITVIAVRPARPEPGVPAGPVASRDESLVIREAGPADLDAAAEFEMAVIRYDAQFGMAILRPATEALVRAETRAALAARPARAWLAERDGEPIGLDHVQPPGQSGWIAGMTRAGR